MTKVATLSSPRVTAFLVLLSMSLPAAATAGQQRGTSPERELLDQYCVSCHSDTRRVAGLALDTVDVANVGEGAEVWEKVVTKLRAGMMPPAGRPRPDQASYVSLTSYLETELDGAAAVNPEPGRSDALRRLNATEYRNAIRDLLDLEIDVTALLPADDSSAGFDNVSLGGLDPGRLERYLTAARKISRLAVGAEVRSAVADTFIVPSDLNQTGHIEGLPFGTRGGSTVRYNFPVDAEYELRVELGKSWNSNSVGGLHAPQDVVITVDGAPVTTRTVTRPQRRRRPPAQQQPAQQPPQQNQPQQQGQQNQPQGQEQGQRQQAVSQFLYQPGGRPADADLFVRVPVAAGPRTVGAAFVSQGFQLLERHRQPFDKIHITVGGDQRAEPNVYSITITGPFDATGPGDTPSRRRIFSCRPAGASQTSETACAEDILSTLARRAYRRPVTDADVALLLGFYREGREAGDFETGIEMALRRLLVSPEFLFRVERDPEGGSSRPYDISDLELASRLSFFLWASIPDDQLIDVAANGTLRDPAVLESQVRRMLADPRADTLVTNFAAQWLYLRNLGIHLTAPGSLQCCNLAPGPARRWEGQGPWLRPRPLRCDGATPLGLGVHHEMPVGERWRADGKVHQAVEEQPARSRVPSVETEAELVEVPACRWSASTAPW